MQPIELLIAGDGTERARLESLAHSSDARQSIHFVGQLDDMPSFWRKADVVVVPSEITESFSMATLESMACAKPVLATRNGGMPELVVDGVTGTVVPRADANVLAQALVTYAARPALRLAHGAAARARAIERFHIDDCARAYLDLFGELTTSRPLKPRRQRGDRTRAKVEAAAVHVHEPADHQYQSSRRPQGQTRQ